MRNRNTQTRRLDQHVEGVEPGEVEPGFINTKNTRKPHSKITFFLLNHESRRLDVRIIVLWSL